VDSLGYLLENHGVKGFKLPRSEAIIIDKKFANDTNPYLARTLGNKAKATLDLFAIALGSKINWNKSNVIWIYSSPMPFE